MDINMDYLFSEPAHSNVNPLGKRSSLDPQESINSLWFVHRSDARAEWAICKLVVLRSSEVTEREAPKHGHENAFHLPCRNVADLPTLSSEAGH
jgi:hypothetical protein